MIVLVFAIPAVVILASLLVLAASRRNEITRTQGQLSKETLLRDEDAHKAESTGPAEISGREIERAAVIERLGGGEIEVPETATPVPWTAPDEEAVGVARR